jgi:hypothetical protein
MPHFTHQPAANAPATPVGEASLPQYDFQPPCPELSKGNNRADRIRITSDRSHIKFLLDTPDNYVGHAGEILVLNDDECVFEFSDGSTLNVDAMNVFIEPPIAGLDSTNAYDAFAEILTLVGPGSDDQRADEVPIDPIPNLTPPATEVQTALELLAEQQIVEPTSNPVSIAPTATGVVDTHTPTTQSTYEWTVTVVDTVTGDYRSSKVLAIYDGSSVEHSVYEDVGAKIKRDIEVVLAAGPTVTLEVTNNDTNTIEVSVARFPIIES